MNKHWHKNTEKPTRNYNGEYIIQTTNEYKSAWYDGIIFLDMNNQGIKDEDIVRWAYLDELVKQPMDYDMFEDILSAMSQALNVLDDLSNPDFDMHRRKLDKAIDRFYSWFTK